MSGCKTGIDLAGYGSPVVDAGADTLFLAGNTTGLVAADDVVAEVTGVRITNPSGGTGLFTTDSAQGTFSGLVITGGGTGIKAESDSVHTVRDSKVTQFTSYGVNVSVGGRVDLGTTGDAGNNSIYPDGTSPIRYVNAKNHLAELGPVKEELNWWGADPPPSTKFTTSTVDYTPWLTEDPLQGLGLFLEVARVVEVPRVWASPNPSRDVVRLRLQGVTGEAVVSVYDLRGREVRRWREPAAAELVWDGRNGQGGLMPPGVYFVRVGWSGGSQTVKVIRGR